MPEFEQPVQQFGTQRVHLLQQATMHRFHGNIYKFQVQKIALKTKYKSISMI